jgi:class 3 adenylate cyclase/pimeloyl-ACP methyl ester carboxylesterase
MAEPQIRYCTTTDGVSIAYYTMGEGETLLLASNVLFSNVRNPNLYLPEYQRVGEGLGRGMRVVRYDSRGSGMSDRSALDFSLEARIKDLDAVVQKLRLDSFVLAASAYGCIAAVEYAARNPGNVRRLVLVNPIVNGPEARSRVRRWDSLRAMASEEWEDYTTTMAAANVGHDDPELIRTVASRMRESMSPVAVQAAFEALVDLNVEGSLPRLSMPVLVLYRQFVSRFNTEEDARAVASAIADCELAVHVLAPGSFWSAEDTATVERFLGVEAEPAAAATTIEQRTHRARQPSGGLQTILFTDIEANTELLQRVGDAAWRDILREHERTTRAILAEHGGTEIKTIGDAFMTAFGSASAALECAIALQRAFSAEDAQPGAAQAGATQAGAPALHQLRIRIGVNAGEPIAEDDDLFGTAVTTAARIQGLAKGGEVLVSDVVRQLVAGKGFMFEDRGEQVLRGFEDPVRVFALRVP